MKTTLSIISLLLAGATLAQNATSLQDMSGTMQGAPQGTNYTGREIISMDPSRPKAYAVAVLNGEKSLPQVHGKNWAK
jgi:hypothetical protein